MQIYQLAVSNLKIRENKNISLNESTKLSSTYSGINKSYSVGLRKLRRTIGRAIERNKA